MQNATPTPPNTKPNCYECQIANYSPQWNHLLFCSLKTLGLFCLTFYHPLSPEEQGVFCPVLALTEWFMKVWKRALLGDKVNQPLFCTICPFHYHVLLKATISVGSSGSLLVCVCIVHMNACMNTSMGSKDIKLNLFGEDYHNWHQQESLSPIEPNSFKFCKWSENSLSIKSKHVTILYMHLQMCYKQISWQFAHDHACQCTHTTLTSNWIRS